MNQHLEDFSTAITSARNTHEAWDQSVRFFESLGFKGAFYGSRTGAMDLNETDVRISSGLSGWRDAYFEHRDYQTDPLFVHARYMPRSFLTGVEFLDDYPFLTTDDVAVIRRASDFGLRSGIAMKILDGRNDQIRSWNLVSDLGKEDLKRVYSCQGGLLSLSATLADLVMSTRPKDTTPDLSLRETEALCWLASGLRTDRIADRMGLRPVTVDLHIRNARKKLGARTREQALAIAIHKGLLPL